MRDLYDRLNTEGEAGIERLVTERFQEGLQLDFKRKEVDRNGTFTTNARQMLAEALSGFANSGGGLLIIGVDARPGSDHIDCAQDIKPIADIARFQADANTEIGRLVQPKIDNVLVSAIQSNRVVGAGYLLVLVERSERRPHRSEAKGRHQYYKRVGDSFYEMEHYDIEDAFSRAQAATLRFSFTFHNYIRSTERLTYQVSLFLENVSEFIAKLPYVIFNDLTNAAVQTPDPSLSGVRLRSAQSVYSLVGSNNDVIHPGMIVQMGSLTVVLTREGQHPWKIAGTKDEFAKVSTEAIFGCEGARGSRATLSFQVSDFLGSV